MTVRVKLFARARDLARSDYLDIELAEGQTVADLRRAVVVQCPTLAGLAPRCLLAVDNEFAADEAMLGPNQEIALLPPVSGG
ncbi:MAG: MoaD/ThiS family protein [Gemmataceae bacterium]